MRKIIVTTTFLFFIATSYSQVKFGAKAGVNFAALTMYQNKSTHTTGYKAGLHAGAFVDISAGKNFSILTEANYNRFGGSDKGSSFLKTEYEINYFSMPIMLKYNFETGLGLYAGPQLSFSATAKSKNILTSSGIQNDLNEIELASVFGAEYNFKNGLFLTGRYNLGMTNIVKREYGNSDFVKNRGITIAIGYHFNKMK